MNFTKEHEELLREVIKKFKGESWDFRFDFDEQTAYGIAPNGYEYVVHCWGNSAATTLREVIERIYLK